MGAYLVVVAAREGGAALVLLVVADLLNVGALTDTNARRVIRRRMSMHSSNGCQLTRVMMTAVAGIIRQTLYKLTQDMRV